MKRFKLKMYNFLSKISFGKLKDGFLKNELKYRKKLFPQEFLINDVGKNNQYDKQKIEKYGITLKIEGDNNQIILPENMRSANNVSMSIIGSNNIIELKENVVIGENLNIIIGFPSCHTHNSVININEKVMIVDVKILALEEGSKCCIDKGSLLADKIEINLSDTHSIFDLDGNLINYGGNVYIGERVWIGRSAMIMKNVSIAHDSIVGACAVVAKKFDESNIVIAGNPAKKIKSGVTWNCNPPNYYKNLQEQEIKEGIL